MALYRLSFSADTFGMNTTPPCDICEHGPGGHYVGSFLNRTTGRHVLAESCIALGCFCWRKLSADLPGDRYL